MRLIQIDGEVNAPPLVLSDYSVNGMTHEVVIVATEHDSVYAFDAGSGVVLWQVSVLGSSESPSDDRGCVAVTPKIGATATPVVDRAAGSLFLPATSKDASGNHYPGFKHTVSPPALSSQVVL